MSATAPVNNNDVFASDVFADMASKAVETMSLWADVSQKILRELVDLSASTAKEGVRLYADLQASAVEALRDGQSRLRQRPLSFDEIARDPVGFYHRAVADSVESAQRAFRAVEGNAQAVSRSAERLQATAEQASTEIQASVTQLAGRLQQLYAPGA